MGDYELGKSLFVIAVRDSFTSAFNLQSGKCLCKQLGRKHIKSLLDAMALLETTFAPDINFLKIYLCLCDTIRINKLISGTFSNLAV